MSHQPDRQSRKGRLEISTRWSLAAILFAAATIAGAQAPVEYPIPLPSPPPSGNPPTSFPQCITAHSDGNLYVAERNDSQIGQITPQGQITNTKADGGTIPNGNPLPGLQLRMQCITSGPDGNLWYTATETGFGRIGYLTPGAAAPTVIDLLIRSRLEGITAGPDGNIWFAEGTASKIGRIDLTKLAGCNDLTPTCLTEYPVKANSYPAGIVAACDGALWFTERDGNQIGKITTSGFPTEYPIPTANSSPIGITVGPDGALWFAESAGNQIGRIPVSGGTPTEYSIPTSGSRPQYITTGGDLNLWFTESTGNKIGHMSATGQMINEIGVPTSSSQPIGITRGPAGSDIWFTESSANQIGVIAVPGSTTLCAPATALFLQGRRFKVEVAWAVPPQGQSGVGKPVTVAADTGAFWFFSSNNLENMVKVLDGRTINGKWWVFYGALSNVDYTIKATDLQTGASKSYHNPYGTLGSNADTSAFSEFSPPPEEVRSASREVEPALAGFDPADLVRAEQASALAPFAEAAQATCTPDTTSLCLAANRFKVQVAWRVPSQGTSGVGTASPLTSDTGNFWFFSSNNLELIVKVLDARVINNHFWVFYGALSNVEYTITITDTQTGAVRTYLNPDQTLASFADTNAF